MMAYFFNRRAWLLSVLALVLVATSLALAEEGNAPSVGDMLREFAAVYSEVPAESTVVVVQLKIAEPDEAWYVLVSPGGPAELNEGFHESPAITISMSKSTLERIHRGEITAFTAGGKGSGADTAPLEMEFHAPAGNLADPKGTVLGFLQHFFTATRPERIMLGEDHSRVVHGAHAIPLYYAPGFRSAWYKVKEGQRLNEPGDTNPYPQAFVIISGRGHAKIGECGVEVKAGESYYVPAGADHVLWPAEGEALELIWMAWGEGA
jgi:mannose-6-phosphate isomerase-like protein (cupin superfamily)